MIQNRFYPVGIQSFERIRKEQFVYVDKTAYIYKMVSRTGYYFLLCSDGLLEQMNDGHLLGLLRTDETDEVKRQRLINETQQNADNHSAWLIQIKNVTPEDSDKCQKNDAATARCNSMRYETVAAPPSSKETSAWRRFLKRIF